MNTLLKIVAIPRFAGIVVAMARGMKRFVALRECCKRAPGTRTLVRQLQEFRQGLRVYSTAG
jgi:hypothetical protein